MSPVVSLVQNTSQSGQVPGPADWHPLSATLVTESWRVPGTYVQGNSLAMDLGASLKAQVFLMHNGFITYSMEC